MKPVGVLVCIALTGMLLMFAGCFQTVDRLGTGTATAQPPTPNLVSTPAIIPSTEIAPTVIPPGPPTPTATAVPVPPPTPATPRVVTPPAVTTEPPLPEATSQPVETPSPTLRPIPRLLLEVRSPEDGSQVRSGAVVVNGVVSPETTVTINEEPAILEGGGKFRGAANLVPGENEITVVASDTQGNQLTRVLTVTSIALPTQPFMLLVTGPRDLSIVSNRILRLTGRTGPEAVVSVDGASLAVDVQGNFATSVRLEPGPNIIDVVATNSDGRVMSAVVAIIYRP